jgi:hypothetical protein
MRLLRVSVLRREKTRAYEIFEPTRPGLVRVAAYIHAHRDQGLSRWHDSDVKIDVKDQVRNLLHRARDRKLGAELLCEIGVAAATCLKVRLVCLSLHRPNVDNFKLARSCYEHAQLITEPHQACCFIGSRSVRRPLKARVNQFEIKDGKPAGRALVQIAAMPLEHKRYQKAL